MDGRDIASADRDGTDMDGTDMDREELTGAGSTGAGSTGVGLTESIRALIDREAILDCLNRYSRGLDRKDLEMLRSAFHADATDHHGGPIDYFPAADALITDWQKRDSDRTFSQHLLINTSIELDGDSAHTETYFQLVTGLRPEAASARPPLSLTGGRYVDRFERRDGQWRIARRVLMVEYTAALDAIDRPHHLLWSRRDKTDASYARPLLGPPAPSGEPDQTEE